MPMPDGKQRQYLEDVPTDIQDLIFEDRGPEAIQLLMTQRGLGRMEAAMEAARIATRMKETFPDAVPGPSSGSGLGLTSRQKSLIAWAFVLLFAVAGCAAIFSGVRGIIMGKASGHWPSVKGTVTRSEAVSTTSNKKSGGTVYHTRIVYEFTVDGHSHPIAA